MHAHTHAHPHTYEVKDERMREINRKHSTLPNCFIVLKKCSLCKQTVIIISHLNDFNKELGHNNVEEVNKPS